MKWTSDNSGGLGRGGSEAVANGSRGAIALAKGASALPSVGISSAAAVGDLYRVPTPTEQTPSPRKGMPSGGGGVFAFGVDSPDSSSPDKRDEHEYFEANGGGSKRAGGCGGNLGKGYHEQGRGVSPARGWRSEDAGGGESDDEVEGGDVDAGFREELDVFASSLRKDFELKVGLCAVVVVWELGGRSDRCGVVSCEFTGFAGVGLPARRFVVAPLACGLP